MAIEKSIMCAGGSPARVGDYVRVEKVIEGGKIATYAGTITHIFNDGESFVLDNKRAFVRGVVNVYFVETRDHEPKEDIATLKAKIKELEKKAAELEKYKVYADMANEIAVVRQIFIDAGFTREEAFNMTMTFVLKGMEMSKASWRN